LNLSDIGGVDVKDLQIATLNGLVKQQVTHKLTDLHDQTLYSGDVTVTDSDGKLIAKSFVVFTTLVTGLEDQQSIVKAFPNPVSNVLTIYCEDATVSFNYELISLTGQVLMLAFIS
jgi:hypothetical protein